MVDYQNTAQGIATLGRGGDSTLVHMQPEEVEGLQQLALANGTSLTVNPNTGMPEAFNLKGLIPMVAGVGLAAANMDPMMAGLLLGGTAALMEGDLGAGLGAGLGAYGGASLGQNLFAKPLPAGATTGEAVKNQIQQNISSVNPTIPPGPSGTSMTGFSGGAGGGAMGIPNAGNAVSGNYPTAFQNTTNPNSNILGQGNIPQANLQPASARGYQYTPNEIAGRAGAANNPIYNNYTNVGGYTSAAGTNATNSNMPSFMNQNGAQQAANNAGKGITDGLSIRDIKAASSEPGFKENLSRMGDTAKNIVTNYSETRDAMGLDNTDMLMKYGLPVGMGLAGGLEPEDFQEELDMTQFEDRRFRGPDGQLNLSGKTALNLNNPYGYSPGSYGYAFGGAVSKERATMPINELMPGGGGILSGNPISGITGKPMVGYNTPAEQIGGAVSQGMEAALARNGGMPANFTPSTPSTPASNINIEGSNMNDLGSLNVNTGEIGQSPNEIAAEVAEAAAEAAKPKFRTVYGGMGSSLGFGPQQVPIDYNPGNIYQPASHYKDREGNWHKGINPNPGNMYGFAEGGAVEQGMAAALARNGGVASIAPAPASSVNTGGISNFNDLGSLNVNTGVIGKSPNEIAAEAAKPVTMPINELMPASGTNVGGGAPSGGNTGFSVPTKFVVGQGTMPADAIMAGPAANYYRDIAGNYIRRAQGGSLNVNSGKLGKSPNEIAAEAAKPVTLPINELMPASGTNVPSELVMGQGYMPTGAIMAGPAQNYYRDISGKYIRKYAEGGYLGGGDINVQGDGMSDDIPASIDNEQPAALSEGEFVIPADVVSHIGNGSSEAGAKEFYGMMDRVRMARTGRKKQSPEINPQRFMPA